VANNPFFADAPMIAALTAWTNAASPAGLNSGFLEIWSGAQPGDANQALTGVKLAKLTFAATAFSSIAASGATGSRIVTATAGAITASTGGNTVGGTAGYFALLASNDTTVIAMGSVGATSGFDLNLTSTTIVTSATVSCSAFTITITE
jgi:hypothetical protein